MEEEFDPILERRAREAKETKTRNLTVAAVVLGVIALGLCGALYYVWNKYNGADVRNPPGAPPEAGSFLPPAA